MPFPLIPLAINALPLLGGLFNRNKPSKQAGQSLSLLQRAQDKGFQVADKAQAMSNPLMRGGTQALGQGTDYFSDLLSGNRGRMMGSVAPELDEINTQFQGARSAIAGGPRGGGRTSALAQLPGQQAAAQSRLLSSIRPGAASSLLGAGSAQLGAGSSLLNSAVQGIYGGSNAASRLLDYDLQQQQANQARNSALGGSIFDFVRKLPGIFAGAGGGDSASSQPGSGNFAA